MNRMSVIKFEFEKTYQEIEVAGRVYKLDLSDDAVKNHQKAIQKYYDEAMEISKVDAGKLNVDEQHELFDRMRNTIADLLDGLLGVGSFKTLYADAGESLNNLTEFVATLADIIRKHSSKMSKSANALKAKQAIQQKNNRNKHKAKARNKHQRNNGGQ